MVSNDDFGGKATHFYLHINFEQKYPKPAIVARLIHKKGYQAQKCITTMLCNLFCDLDVMTASLK